MTTAAGRFASNSSISVMPCVFDPSRRSARATSTCPATGEISSDALHDVPLHQFDAGEPALPDELTDPAALVGADGRLERVGVDDRGGNPQRVFHRAGTHFYQPASHAASAISSSSLGGGSSCLWARRWLCDSVP